MALLRCDVMSDSLKMATSIILTLPENRPLGDVPVIYLLHGLTDNCTGWTRYTRAEQYARMHGAALVMPEVQRSFYTDMSHGSKYFSYVHDELPALCESMFRLENRPEHTYIMGLSMGGYGALKCALTTPERYAGCAAFSSVCAIGPAMQRLGMQSEVPALFEGGVIPPEDDLFALVKATPKAAPKIFQACGQQDVLYPENCRLRDALQGEGLPLEWREWPGAHSWFFWDEALSQAMDYFLGPIPDLPPEQPPAGS